MTTESKPPSWFERNSNVILWLVGTVAALLLSYGDLRTKDTALAAEIQAVRDERAAHDQGIKTQLDRIETKIQSIEEFLREHDKQTAASATAR